MNRMILILLMFLAPIAAAETDKVFLLSKRQIVNSTHTLVVFFHDRAIANLSDCQREIQRGNRGQWRYYNHTFPRPTGYSQNIDYHCIKVAMNVAPWYEQDPYSMIYQIDIRTSEPKIKLTNNYAECLNDLRRHVRDETRKFFCAKLSQSVTF